jgi:energy-coupling factor transport system substrate-specific component
MALICAAAGFAYGLVLNFYTFVTFTGQHTLAQFLVIEGSAFSFDLAHAIGNFVFYLAFGPALVRALQRFRLRMDVAWGPVTAVSLVLVALLGTAATAVPAARARASTPAVQSATVLLAATVPQPALAYLARAQNPDGGFGLSPGQPSSQLASAWVVIAIAAAGRDPAALRRDGHDPVAWIRGHLDQLQGPGDLERTIIALAAAHAPLGTLVAELEQDQRRDGSVGEQSNLTAFAILAWRAAHASGVPAAAAWLARQQDGDGGFGFALRGDPGDVDDTAAAIEALTAARAAPAVVARARAFVLTNENRDGGFPLEPGGASDAQSTAWAIQALCATGSSARRPLAYLRARLTRSGAVAYAAGETITPVWVTAEALAGFARAPLPIDLGAKAA